MVQRFMESHNKLRVELPATTSILAGGTAGITLWLGVYPIDVIKSCIQTDSLDPSKRQYHGSLDVIRQLYARGGVRAFFRGLEPTLLRVRATLTRHHSRTRQPLLHSSVSYFH